MLNLNRLRYSQGKEDSAAVANITAVLLSCLQALPLHEATHNVPIGLGPPWMNTAKDLLLTLLPSASTIVRRAAAEGLALLATLGVTEDAHFLQSTLLHSLDEVMQGNKPDGKARTIALEPVSAARAGSLLTLACIQRTAHNVSKRKSERARGRVVGSKTGEAVDKSNENLPVLQMMTRIIPSAACHGFKDFFVVKAYALHSFAVLLIYSARLNSSSLADEDKQLLRKAVELVEDNFSASWTAASADIDRGQEAEKLTTEVAFLAIILRFMTFLLPFVGSLESEDRDITRRFSVMAAVILDFHRSHPVISLEAMAFFEVLAAHQKALPPLSRNVIYTENPVLSCIPTVLSLLGTVRPSVFAGGLWNPNNSLSSGKSLRAVVYVITVLSRSHISIAQWSEMNVVALLIASLEGVCGAKHFSGGNMLRSAAASREIERFFAEGASLESEIFHAVPTILALEANYHNYGGSTFLRWLLLSRHILSSSPSSSETEAAGYTRNDVVAAALARATSDASPVYDAANPVRWQVKSLAAQLAAESLCEMLANERNDGRGPKDSPQFDFNKAKIESSEECRRASEIQGRLPGSRAIFHLEDLLASASVSSVATIDQAELRTVQESSMHFFVQLIECFGPIPDPEDASSSILDQFATQIFSSVKHALAATDCIDSVSPCLFVTGCEVLHKVVETRITSDPMVFKRLFRPTVIKPDLLPPFKYADGYPSELLQVSETVAGANTRSALAVRVGSIWTAGKFLLPRGTEDYAPIFESVGKELIPDNLGLAIHSAACAVDGCRLLRSSKLSLVGLPILPDQSNAPKNKGGFLFQNETDIDDSVKELLVRTWSSCGSRALKPLVETMESHPDDQDRCEMCKTWIEKIVSLLIAGIYDALSAIKSDGSRVFVDWARGIDAANVVEDCLGGMSILASHGSANLFSSDDGSRIQNLVVYLFENVWLPALAISGDSASNEQQLNTFDDSVLLATCGFMRSLAESKSDVFHQKTSLLVTLLKPLNLLQNGEVKLGYSGVNEIVMTCLTSIGALIQRGDASGALVKTMLQLALNDVLSPGVAASTSIRAAGKALMIDCLTHSSMARKEQERIARELAISGNWDGWVAVSAIDGGSLIVKSLDVVQKTLQNSDKPEAQVNALTTVRVMVQKETIPSTLVGQILFNCGADVIGALYQYGTMKVPETANSHRMVACADAMKIVLSAYQQISSEESDEQVSVFLSVAFGALLAVLRFNGVPNHASPEVHGDPALGRMCAQAILHVARTTPAPFKSCVAALGDHERPLLEFAVRAEMSGYAIAGQQQQQPKKKISLAGFKK